MPETVRNQIDRCRRRLMAMHRPEFNRLDGAVDDVGEVITLSETLRALGPGSRVAIDDELLYVWSTDVSGKTATVLRGDLGSTAVAHVDGSIVEVNPRFPAFEIRDVLTEEIRSWPNSLFRVVSHDAIVSAGSTAVDSGISSEEWLAVLNVTRSPYGSTRDTLNDVRIPFRIERNLDPARFTSGAGIFLDSVAPSGGTTMRVTMAMPFDTTDLADTVEMQDVGLTTSMYDIPALGVAARLVANRETIRTFTEGQGEPRRSEEIPPMYATQASQGLMKLRDKRIAEEAQRLLHRYPWRQMR